MSNLKLIVVAVIVVVIAAGIFFIYRAGKKSEKGKKPPPIKLPPGVDIKTGWSPTPDVVAIYGAIKGPGTDEDAIWDVLEGKNKAELALIYNEFASKYGEDLFDWFRDDLSGDDLRRALGYFAGVV